MQNNKLFLIIIGVLILLLLGLVFVPKAPSPLAKLMESKVIGNITTTASGEVVEITGRTLTLKSEEDILAVPIGEEVSIYRLTQPEDAESGEKIKKISFEEINIGNKVEVGVYLKADGTLEAKHVLLLPD